MSERQAYLDGLADGRAEERENRHGRSAWAHGYDQGAAMTYAAIAHDLAEEGHEQAAWQVAAWAEGLSLPAVGSDEVLPDDDPRRQPLPPWRQ